MNMVCANPECVAELKYLRGGRLFLMERQPSLSRSGEDKAAAPKRPVAMRRYFWLCESCAQSYAIQRWTESGIELAPKRPVRRISAMDTGNPRGWSVPGLVG